MDEASFPAAAPGGPELLRNPQGRFAAPEELAPYRGGLYTLAETAEFEKFATQIRPMSDLPRTAPAEPPAALPYRRRVYGPFGPGLAIEAEGLLPGEPFEFRYALHRGQTKLCAIELEALGRALARVPGLKYVLYAGAAPGSHILFLAETFPELEFHLYDPAEFRLQSAHFAAARARVHATRALFTDEVADAWKARGAETFFISDIRSGDHSQEEFEGEVWANMQMQQRWWRAGAFAAGLFKFRLPYTAGPPCSAAAEGAACAYLAGEVLLQPFAPLTSTEGRLLVWAGAPEAAYDAQKYETFFFWLNTVVREWGSFAHGFPFELAPGLCLCFDCARLVQILREHAAARPDRSFASPDLQVAHLLGRMALATGQSLAAPPHGTRPGETAAEKRRDLARAHHDAYARQRERKIGSHARAVQHARPVVQAHARPPKERPAEGAARAPARAPPAGGRSAGLGAIALPPAATFRRPGPGRAFVEGGSAGAAKK